jgi:hypothetical protein
MGKKPCPKGIKRGVLASLLTSMAVDASKFDRTNTKLQLEVVTYDSKYDLQQAYKRLTGDRMTYRKTEAFAQWNDNVEEGEYWCTIHILDWLPKEDLVHEIKHCLKGEWHKPKR